MAGKKASVVARYRQTGILPCVMHVDEPKVPAGYAVERRCHGGVGWDIYRLDGVPPEGWVAIGWISDVVGCGIEGPYPVVAGRMGQVAQFEGDTPSAAVDWILNTHMIPAEHVGLSTIGGYAMQVLWRHPRGQHAVNLRWRPDMPQESWNRVDIGAGTQMPDPADQRGQPGSPSPSAPGLILFGMVRLWGGQMPIQPRMHLAMRPLGPLQQGAPVTQTQEGWSVRAHSGRYVAKRLQDLLLWVVDTTAVSLSAHARLADYRQATASLSSQDPEPQVRAYQDAHTTYLQKLSSVA